MPDEGTQAGTSASGGTTDAGTGAQAAQQAQAVANQVQQAQAGTSDAQNVDQLPEWAQKQIRDLRSEAAGYRTKAKEFEDKISAEERAKLSKEEQLQAERDEARKQAQAADKRAKDMALKSAFVTAATKHGIVHIEDAFKLADLSKIEFDPESGDPKGVEDAVKAIAKDKPFLLASGASGGGASATNAARGGGQQGKSIDDLRADLYGTGSSPFDPFAGTQMGGGVRSVNKQ